MSHAPEAALPLRSVRWGLEAASGALRALTLPRFPWVERKTNVAYADSGLDAHRLDIYRPTAAPDSPRPAVLYLHGGGFRILSKDTHWMMGLGFAQRGYTVFSANYRLAPEHRFPSAVDDAVAAFRWVRANAASWGADPERIVVAGESAGANLALALALQSCLVGLEGHEALPTPAACLSLSGFLHVSSDRPDGHAPPFVRYRIRTLSECYLGDRFERPWSDTPLANPLPLLESEADTHRPLPPVYISAGTRDPVLEDSERLAHALARRGARHRLEVYPGEPHGFQALWFREGARSSWESLERWLSQTLPNEG